MEILSGLESLPEPRLRSPIVTWGVFDGVHRGHRVVLSQVLEWARREGVSSALVTFDRHPEEVLRGTKVPMVTPLGERLREEHAVGHGKLRGLRQALARYEAEGSVGGKLAQIGQRLVDAAARKMADDFFARFSDAVAPRASQPAAAEPTGEAAPRLSFGVIAAAVVGLIAFVAVVVLLVRH